ncbi:unnamed protein product [Urochloa decumbens]|uniref:Cysteine-rich transmembrane domain-containing protein n=1 Tax=Urochloa decumbens TaxID=240449 RepID=A0ABC9FXE9_9POAL
MLHRNTSHRDGGQGETPTSSPSATRSPSGSSRPTLPMTPPSAPATPREPQEQPPAAKRGFVVGFVMAVCCCCLADETIM